MFMTNRLVACITAACAMWVFVYTLFAGRPLRSFYAQISDWVLGDPKGGVPVVCLALPILIAGTASICWRLPSPTHAASSWDTLPTEKKNSLPTWVHRWIHRFFNVEGDWSMDLWAMSLILLPSVVFVAATIYRHMHENEIDLDQQLAITSDAFAMVSEVVGSILLIPIARQSSLLKVVGWSEARAVRVHIWAGRIFIIAVLIHGGMHMFRWMGNERLATMMVPPAACWTWDEEQYSTVRPACEDDDTECTCYAMFQNFTGVGGGVALLALMITSLHEVRRKFYNLFYMSHIIAAPLATVLVVLHWNRSILFMAPSLLYYTATSLPTFLENCFKSRYQGVKIVSVERIPCLPNSKKDVDVMTAHYISLTFEATALAVQKFRPGYYIQLMAPHISSISHPFTVNTVAGKDNQLRVVFKALGRFTSDLSNHLQEATLEQQTTSWPKLHINGYLGTPNRVGEVLRHDVAVMVAGGIGVTPYLSLLHQVHDILSEAPPNAYPTKRIVLLWSCRDANLVDYVKREYLQPILDAQERARNGFKFVFIIHHSGDSTFVPTYSSEENHCTIQKPLQSLGIPFSPSLFSAGSSTAFKFSLLRFLAFCSIAWTGLAAVWWLFAHVQHEEAVTMRMTGLVAILIIGMFFSLIANLLAAQPYFQLDENAEKDNGTWQPLLETAQGMSTEFSNIEMEGLQNIEEGFGRLSDSDLDDSEMPEKVFLEEKQGRPSIQEILNYADGGRHPGLFTCGPLGLMQDIREHTEERCILRLQQCMRGASHHIALYEEAFAM